MLKQNCIIVRVIVAVPIKLLLQLSDTCCGYTSLFLKETQLLRTEDEVLVKK